MSADARDGDGVVDRNEPTALDAAEEATAPSDFVPRT